MKFGRILKELRAEKELSQVQLANETGLSKSAIASWEMSKHEPTASALIILAKFFDVTAGQLLGLEDYLK